MLRVSVATDFRHKPAREQLLRHRMHRCAKLDTLIVNTRALYGKKCEEPSTGGPFRYLPYRRIQCTYVVFVFQQVDQSDQKVYRPGTQFDEPMLVGRLVHSGVELAAEDMRWLGRPPPDLIYALDHYLKLNQCRLRDFFNEFDTDGYGTLSEKQLRKLVLRVLPEASEEELRYFQVGPERVLRIVQD